MVIFGVWVDGEMIPRLTPDQANVLCQVLTAATGVLWCFDFA